MNILKYIGHHLSLVPYARFIGLFILWLGSRLGEIALFVYNIFASMISMRFSYKNLHMQLINIGFYSLPIVGITALFTGSVLALQSYTGFSRFAAESSVSTVVVLSITRELAPVMTGLVVAGRVGAAMAAELGTMRVTEQIDALESLSTDPISYLVAPRALATLISVPLLVLVADVIGVIGGYSVGVYKLAFNSHFYIQQTFRFLYFADVMSGLIKAAIFGLAIAIVSCYQGFYTTKGAKGVGISTNQAVVNSSLLILFLNYLVTSFLFKT
jgi:phospholipid/cholesterol/gamma-HCH transport system permease protein